MNDYSSTKNDEDKMECIRPCWRLRDEAGNPVCTFIPRVLSLIRICSLDGDAIEEKVKFLLVFEDGASDEIIVALSGLERINWSKFDIRCIFSTDCRNPRGYVANIIRAGLQNASVETVFRLGQLGIHHIRNQVFFAAGNRVIGGSSATDTKLNIELEPSSFHLDIDANLTPQEAFYGMRELMCINPEIGRVLVAHVISGITRRAFKEAGLTPCTVLVIAGESGMMKSSYVPHLTQLYNRADGIRADTRFNSTKRFIEDILCEYSECTAVIDDLHTAESRGIKRRNEDTAEEIIRRISDNTGRGRMDGHTMTQKQFKGNAVFIGEYTIGMASTVPRELIVKITKRPNGEILDKYQRHQPFLVSTFYFFFIQWYVNHFDSIKDEIDKRLTELRKQAKNHDIHGRLCDTQFYLQISYMLFLEFCKDSGFISEQNEGNEYRDFASYLNILILEQQTRFKSSREMEKVDYLNLIRNLYKQGRFSVAKKRRDFNPNKHEGVIHYGCLCVCGKCLEQKLRNINAGYRLDDCVKELLAKNALKLVKAKNTVQISEIGGKRFYAIRLEKLT